MNASDFSLATLFTVLATLTNVERVALFTEIFSRYCQHCGRVHSDKERSMGYRCQCWNDE